MKSDELRQIIENIGLSQADFARLIDVTPRAISMWLAEDREVAGPVSAYLRLLVSLPRALQAEEIARIKKEDPKMYEGMYLVNFQGAADSGQAALVLQDGKVFGIDGGGVQYDGSYQPSQKTYGHVDLHFRLTVPAGVPLVQGIPAQPMSYWFDLDCAFAVGKDTPNLKIETPLGPVVAQIKFLRRLPN